MPVNIEQLLKDVNQGLSHIPATLGFAIGGFIHSDTP